jgi:hypothetical protein
MVKQDFLLFKLDDDEHSTKRPLQESSQFHHLKVHINGSRTEQIRTEPLQITLYVSGAGKAQSV